MAEHSKKSSNTFRKLFPSLFFSQKSQKKGKNALPCSTDAKDLYKRNLHPNPLAKCDERNQEVGRYERIYENCAPNRIQNDNERLNDNISSHHFSSSTLVSESIKSRSMKNNHTTGPQNICHMKYVAIPQVPPKPKETANSRSTPEPKNDVYECAQYPDVYYHSLEHLTNKISHIDDIDLYNASQSRACPASVGAEIKRVSTKFLISPKKESEVRRNQPKTARSLSLDNANQIEMNRITDAITNWKMNNVRKTYNYSAPTSPMPISHKIPKMPQTVSPYESVRKTMNANEEKKNSLRGSSDHKASTPIPFGIVKSFSNQDNSKQVYIDKKKTRDKVEAFYWQKLKELKEKEDEYLIQRSLHHSLRSAEQNVSNNPTYSFSNPKSYSLPRGNAVKNFMDQLKDTPFVRGVSERRTDTAIKCRSPYENSDIYYRYVVQPSNITSSEHRPNILFMRRDSTPTERQSFDHTRRVNFQENCALPDRGSDTCELSVIKLQNKSNENYSSDVKVGENQSRVSPLSPTRTTSVKNKKNTYLTVVRSLCSESESGSEAGEIQRILHSSSRQKGTYQHWTSFKDLFTETIHNNPTLSSAQKMQFLKGKVRGEAERLIHHLPISSDNYNTCWEILNHRYNNKKLIFTSIMNTLLGLPSTQQQTLGNIKKLHDVALESLHAIRNLGVDIATWDPLLVHLLSQKLDSETYGDYIDSLKNSRELPILQEFLDYLESKFTSMEASRRKQDQVISKSYNNPHHDAPENQKTRRYNASFHNKFNKPQSHTKTLHVSTIKCQLCNQQHALFNCAKFLKMPNDIKLNTVLKLKLCKNCLFDHNGQQCISVRRCRKCAGNHHSVLHDACTQNMSQSKSSAITTIDQNQLEEHVPITAHVSQSQPGTNEVLLATALVKVTAYDGSYHVLRALIDPGSQVSLIRESAAKKLGLKRKKFNGLIFGIGEVENNCNGVTTLQCSSTYNNFSFVTDVLIMNNILKDIPHKSFDTSKWSYIENIKLADPYFNVSRQVDLLLSAQVNGMILLGGLIKGENSAQPVLQETQFGWIIYGGGEISSFHCNVVLNNIQNIQQFWEIEDISEKSHLSVEEQQCIDFYEATTKRSEDGRYEVRLPLKPDIHEKLGSSKQIAIAQFKNLEHKFSKQPILANQYKAFISEYLALGHMVPSYSNHNNETRSCYLPHHCVQRAESATTKLRVVFNASARTSSGYSVNDLMYKGPNLQQDLQELILKWRKYRYAYTSDIEKMYRQIMVNKADQQYQQIIWRHSPGQVLQTYNLTTVTYGTKAAPFLAMMTLKRLAADERNRFPDAAKVLEESFYTDDLVHGSHSIDQGRALINELNKLLRTGGFTLRKWAANHPDLLQNIEHHNSNGEIIFNFKSEGVSKTLGLRWNPNNDKFTFSFSLAEPNAKITKRLLLSEISKIFDPLGWLSPLTTKLKLIFQQLWLNKMNWDEEVSQSIKKEWIAINADMKVVNECEIPRWIGYQPNNIIELHGYCDASTKAYAAVIYARIRQGIETSVVLVVAKARLVPISKSVSLPRLELSGAHLLAKLMNKVIHCLCELNIRIYGWTDSMVVLGWLQGEHSRWKPFVANRTKFITDIMKPSCWRYVKSEDNPADAASRGISASQLKNHMLWWQGPQSLKSFDEKLDSKTIYTTDQEIKTKFKPNIISSIQNNKDTIILQLLLKFSSINKIIRILAWILRAFKTIYFVKRETMACQNIVLSNFLTLHELKQAKLLIIKYIQRTEFTNEILTLSKERKLNSKSNLLKLNPFLDKEGVLRVGGRLSNSSMCMDMKHPAILPHSSRLTTLLIQQAHQLTMHGGPRLTLFNLRQSYWIISGNKAVRKIIRNCVICRKHEPRLQHQLMGELPQARSNPAPPFYYTGVDYTGYVEVKCNKGRGIKTTKGYIALFICMATKAIHLELVSDLSSSAFLAALRRMAARRGAPRHLYSDNGTNFVGANRMLQESYHDFKSNYDSNFFAELADLNIEWHYNAPSWPSAGGLWERAVRSLKHHLKRVIGNQKLTFEEFSTILTQVEVCLNSRPLCALSEDIEDLNILTPAHFLTGRCGTGIIETREDARTRWYLSNKLLNDFWKKWKQEYLTQLSIRSKWRRTEQNINIGDLVTIHDDNLPPGKWMMGRVVKTHPGLDGLVRVVTLKTKGGHIKRPVVKLSVLPIEPMLSYQDDSNNIPEDKNQLAPKPVDIKNKKQTSKFASLAISLVYFFSLVTNSHAAFNISILPSNNSLYFESIHNMQVVRDNWHLIVYYDMGPYWEGNIAATKILDYLEKLCSSLSDKGHCSMITLQLNHDYKELLHYNELMLNQHLNARTRQRRGLVNGIGYVANSLFGILDERFAEKYAQDIKLLKENEHHLAYLLRNQTSVVEAEYNVLKRIEQTIQIQHKTINKQLNQLDNAVSTLKQEVENLDKTQDFTLSAIAASNLIRNLKAIQNTLLNTITNVYHGKFDTHLLSPDQLLRELRFISGQLAKDITLPVDNIQSDLSHIYNMLKVKARMMKDYFIFEITLPLTSRDNYKIYKILPVPQQVQNNMISVLPISEYISINLRKDAFFSLSFLELQLCLHNDYSYLCHINKPINHLSIDEKFCKLDNNGEQCIVTKSLCQDKWLELNTPSRYFYFCCNTYDLRIICQDQVAFKQVTAAGIIDLDSKCIIKSKDFTLYSHSNLANTMHSSPGISVPHIADLNYIVNISLSHYPEYEDPLNNSLANLAERIEQLKSANTDSLEYTLSTHDIHQYTVCYGLLGVAVLLAVYVLWRRRQAVSSVELPHNVANSVVFSRKQSTADRQPSEVSDTEFPSVDHNSKTDRAVSPIVHKCRFKLEDV